MKYHKIRNEAGIPIEFYNHGFLKDIYNDMSPLQVVLKAPQIGLTVLQIIKTLYCAYKKKWDIIYTLPTQADVNDMAGGKINRIIAQNPILSQWVKDHDTVEQKSVGENIIYYRGTFSNKQAMMVSSRLNVHDELDASNQSVIEQYETRLQAQANGMRWYFSHPSATDVGVDRFWQQSDQKHWFITCSHCKKEQYLSFPESIDFNSKKYICKSCKGELSDDDRRKGRWIPKYGKEWQDQNGKRPFSGYWISQLMCPWISAEKILDDFNTKSPEYFYNFTLGLPYAGGDSKLTQQALFANLTGERAQPMENERVVIGVDTGLKIDYVMGNQKLGLFFHGDTDGYKELDDIMMRFRKAIVVMDAGGDIIGARQFYERWRGRVFLCFTSAKFSGKEIWKWGEGDKEGQVMADRDQSIQLVVDEFRTRRIPLQGTEGDWWEYWLDWKNSSRIKTFDPKTNVSTGYKWIRNGRDHRAMATVYWRIGMDRFSEEGVTFNNPKDGFGSNGIDVSPDGTTRLGVGFF